MTTATDVIAVETDHLLQVYRRGRVVFERGRGCRLFDAEGRAYLDLISGVGVAALGHANPRLAEAISTQARELLHTSNLYFHPLQGELAARLSTLTGLPRSFFCNSGAEAVEACLKFARKFWGGARTGFVALEHSFHGRTMGSLSVTWDDHYRAPFAPLVPGVTFVPMDDPQALKAAVTASTAAVIVEPLQGEGGVRPLSQAMADLAHSNQPVHAASLGFDVNAQFHNMIAQASQNPVFEILVNILVGIIWRQEHTVNAPVPNNRYVGTAQQHTLIVQAIAEHDVSAARRAMTEHLETTRHNLSAMPGSLNELIRTLYLPDD